MRIPAKAKETPLVASCLDIILPFPCIAVAWRQNTGAARYDGKDGKKYFVRYGEPGVSDIIGFTETGRFLAIECKVEGRTTTPEQAAFLDRVHKARGIALLIRETSWLMRAMQSLSRDHEWMPPHWRLT
jgi:hypothetical protein